MLLEWGGNFYLLVTGVGRKLWNYSSLLMSNLGMVLSVYTTKSLEDVPITGESS